MIIFHSSFVKKKAPRAATCTLNKTTEHTQHIELERLYQKASYSAQDRERFRLQP